MTRGAARRRAWPSLTTATARGPAKTTCIQNKPRKLYSTCNTLNTESTKDPLIPNPLQCHEQYIHSNVTVTFPSKLSLMDKDRREMGQLKHAYVYTTLLMLASLKVGMSSLILSCFLCKDTMCKESCFQS